MNTFQDEITVPKKEKKIEIFNYKGELGKIFLILKTLAIYVEIVIKHTSIKHQLFN